MAYKSYFRIAKQSKFPKCNWASLLVPTICTGATTQTREITLRITLNKVIVSPVYLTSKIIPLTSNVPSKFEADKQVKASTFSNGVKIESCKALLPGSFPDLLAMVELKAYSFPGFPREGCCAEAYVKRPCPPKKWHLSFLIISYLGFHGFSHIQFLIRWLIYWNNLEK